MMRVRRAGAWLLVRVAALILVPVLLALVVFAFVMAILTEGPFLLAAPDWAACWHRCRRVAHVGWAGWDGPTLTGRSGFSGNGCRPDPMLSHYSDHPRAHFVMSLTEYRQVLAITRSDIVSASLFPTAVGHLGGGYGGADVFIDRCPWNCPVNGEAVMGGYVYRQGVATGRRYIHRDPIDADVTAMRSRLRAQPNQDAYSFLDGTS